MNKQKLSFAAFAKSNKVQIANLSEIKGGMGDPPPFGNNRAQGDPPPFGNNRMQGDPPPFGRD